MRPAHREEHAAQRRRGVLQLSSGDAADGSCFHFHSLVVHGQVHRSGHRRDGDHAASVRCDEEVTALAVRARVAAFDFHVDRSVARLDLRFDRPAHLGAQPAIVGVLEPHGRGFVHAHLHAGDADFGLAGLGAQRIAGRETVADLRVQPTALRTALQLHLAFTRDDLRRGAHLRLAGRERPGDRDRRGRVGRCAAAGNGESGADHRPI